MILEREIYPQLLKHLFEPEVLVLTGMRRVGKTTLINQLYNSIDSENKIILDLENPINQKIFEEIDYENIWLKLQRLFDLKKDLLAYIFLDEIQVLPEIAKVIKYLFDHHQIKFVVTGSSSYYFKNLFSESLAGRKFVFEIYPLSFQEFLLFKGKKPSKIQNFSQIKETKNELIFETYKELYLEYLEFGGFPKVVLTEDNETKRLILADIYKSYFEIDVRQLAELKNFNQFRDTMLLLTQRVGSKLDIGKIASEIGVSRETIYKYLYFLENTYFISSITPLSSSLDKELSGSKKVYFSDNGILNYLAKVSSGSLLENSAFNQLKKYGKINYFQQNSGLEIDFILDKKIALEIKQTGIKQDLEKLKKISLDLKLKQSFVLTQSYNPDDDFLPLNLV
jgi:predicted AAA+ superfamily ATPase